MTRVRIASGALLILVIGLLVALVAFFASRALAAKNQQLEGLPDGQVSRPRRFRIMKLEERIAPKKGSKLSKRICPTGACGGTECCMGDGSDW